MAENCGPLPFVAECAVRGSLAWTCLAVLIIKKKYYDEEDRCWKDFRLDCAKQLIGAMWMWLLTSKGVLPCNWHLGSIVAETTIGVPLKYIMLVVLTRLFERGSEAGSKSFRSGEYRDADGNLVRESYIMQVFLWLAAVTGLSCTMPILAPPFVVLCRIILTFFAFSTNLEILMATLFIPSGFYALQVWVTDDILRKTAYDYESEAWKCIEKAFPPAFVAFIDRVFSDDEEGVQTRRKSRSISTISVKSSSKRARIASDEPEVASFVVHVDSDAKEQPMRAVSAPIHRPLVVGTNPAASAPLGRRVAGAPADSQLAPPPKAGGLGDIVEPVG